MGQDVDQALSEIAATRARLEQDIDDLFGRMPEPAALAKQAKTYGAAAAGTAAVVGVVAVRAKSASAQKARRMDARINAEELARAFSPQPPAEPDGGSGKGPMLAALVAAIALVLAVLNRRAE